MNQVRLTPFPKHVNETAEICVDLSLWLRTDETLSLAEVVSNTPSGLTVGGVGVNTSIFTDKNNVTTVPANKGIKLLLSGGSSGVMYEIVLRATNSNGIELPAVTQPIEVSGT